MESNIRSDLRCLIAKYGLPAVHKELQMEMRETFDFLRSIYEPPKNNLVIPVAEVIPDRIVSPKLGSIIPPLSLTQLPQLELSGGIHNEGESENDDTSVIHFPTPVHDPNVKEINIVSKKEIDEFANVLLRNGKIINGTSKEALEVMKMVYKIYKNDKRRV